MESIIFNWDNVPNSVRRQRLKTLGIIVIAITALIGIAIKHADKVEILVNLFNP